MATLTIPGAASITEKNETIKELLTKFLDDKTKKLCVP